jgi:hypothetical protein
MSQYYIKKIVSGGQTGVDRAALDVALEFGIQCGGWCPKGRWAELAPIPEHYPNMIETDSEKPEQRTELNVQDSDGTLIILDGLQEGGTQYTIKMIQRHCKPYIVFDVLSETLTVTDIAKWILYYRIRTLNVAGPRASESEGIYYLASQTLKHLIECDTLQQAI